jgi:hypothetical protein
MHQPLFSSCSRALISNVPLMVIHWPLSPADSAIGRWWT